jgi:hypothetical protein
VFTILPAMVAFCAPTHAADPPPPTPPASATPAAPAPAAPAEKNESAAPAEKNEPAAPAEKNEPAAPAEKNESAAPAGKKPPAAPPATIAKVSAGGIIGRKVLGPDGQEIGRVVDVLVDAASNPRAAVIDFGGFMGVGTRRIAVNWSDLTFPPTGSDADIKLDLSADQIKNAPAYTDQTKAAAVAEPPPTKLPAGATLPPAASASPAAPQGGSQANPGAGH